jgi:hypothetical protein
MSAPPSGSVLAAADWPRVGPAAQIGGQEKHMETTNAGERKSFSAAIAFAAAGVVAFALALYVFDYPGTPKFTIGEIVAAPFFALAALAVIVRAFTRSEAPAWIITGMMFFVLLV